MGRLLDTAIQSSGCRTSEAAARMRCAFIDTSVWPAHAIGAAHEQLAREFASGVEGFVLHTCQRVEVYTLDQTPVLPGPSGQVIGRNSVARRLTEIAAGVRSQVLGERFVLRQVALAGEAVGASPFTEVVGEAVTVATELRRRYEFDAALDYPAAAIRLLTDRQPSRPEWLMVVGGGMLARAIAAHGREVYCHVMVITRSPKRARRRLEQAAESVAVCTPAEANALLGTTRWDAVIATTNLDERYRLQIGALVDDDGCTGAVDLSSTPLRRACTQGYQHMYGPRFSSLVDEQNAVVADRVELVRRAIAEIYEES
ncbi:hypothetical protein ACTD5D_09540 [Nocardia takedensis]|uniref:hypothetical protein n=1 Tax=Nocardia takedensis TaxID=259390 RepID=UPI003F766500